VDLGLGIATLTDIDRIRAVGGIFMSNILSELSEQFWRGNGTLFVGAGLSTGAGLSSWISLLRPLGEAVNYEIPREDSFVTTDHLLLAAQYYENKNGRNALIRKLRDKLDTTYLEPTPVHHLLLRLNIKAIFTTNYDDLIEQTMRQRNVAHNLIVNASDLSLWSEDKIQIVKLCGDLQQPKTIVITSGDFNTYFATRGRIIDRLRTTLENRTVLFLGYSLQDPFFNQIWDNIGLDFGDLRRFGYAVMFDANQLEIEDLRRRGISVINLHTDECHRTELLTEWIRDLLLINNHGQ